MLPKEFIALSQGEAFLICELFGGEYLAKDSSRSLTDRLTHATAADWSDKDAFILESWASGLDCDGPALAERLQALTAGQAHALMSASKTFWRLINRNIGETKALVDAGFISR